MSGPEWPPRPQQWDSRRSGRAGAVRLTVLEAILSLTPLFEERMTGVCGHDHPVAAVAAVDLAEWAAASHVMISLGNPGRNPADDVLARAGLTRRIGLTGHSFAGAMAVLTEGRHMMMLPARLLLIARKFGLANFTLPLDIPAYFCGFLRHPRTEGDSGFDWFEKALVRMVGTPTP